MTYELSSVRQDPDWKNFTASPIGSTIGATITGLDVTRPISDEAADEIRQALIHYHTLRFDGLDLTPAQHVAFSKVFGEVQMGGTIPRLEEQPEVKKQEYTQYASVGGDVNMHADDTFVEIPSKCSLLYGVDMPPAGGDTFWINTEAAYAALSDHMKGMLDNMQAIHDLSAKFGLDKWGMPNHATRVKIHEHFPPVVHPVIRVHPESGRKSIFVNEMVTTRIYDVPEDESDLILKFLFDHLKKPMFQMRMHWPRTGTLIVWDNRSTQHLILPDFQPQYRCNHRVAIKDDVKPIGPADAIRQVA